MRFRTRAALCAALIAAAGCTASVPAERPEAARLTAELADGRARLAEQQAALETMSRRLTQLRSAAGGATPASAEPARCLDAESAAASLAIPMAAPAGDAAPTAPVASTEAGNDRFREAVSDTLRQLLRDPAFAKEFRGAGRGTAGYKPEVDYQSSGFFIQEGDFRLNIEARLQVRYVYANMLDKTRRNGAPDTSDTNKDVRTDFSIPRFRIGFNGTAFTKDLKYGLELNATSSNRAGGDAGGAGIGDITQIQVAYLDYSVFGSNPDVPDFWRQAAQIKVGEFHQAFGHYISTNHWGFTGDGDFQQIDTNIVQQQFRVDRAIGAEFHGFIGGVRDGLPEDRPGTRGFFEYMLGVNNGIQSAGQRYGIDAGATGTAGRGLDKYPCLLARGNFDILKGRYEGTDGKDYYWFGRNASDLEHHETPAWQLGGGLVWQRMRDQNSPADNSVLGDFYRPTQLPERVPVFDKAGRITGYQDGPLKAVDRPGSDIIRANADTFFKWKGFSITGELFFQWLNGLNNPDQLGVLRPNQNQDNLGWFVNGGYFVVKREWELYGGAAGIHSPSRPLVFGGTHAQGLDGSPNADSYQFTFGTNWFPFQDRKLKLQVEGGYLINPPLSSATPNLVQSGGENSWLLRAQMQIRF